MPFKTAKAVLLQTYRFLNCAQLVGWVEQREAHRTMMGFAVALPILHFYIKSSAVKAFLAIGLHLDQLDSLLIRIPYDLFGKDRGYQSRPIRLI